MDEAAAKSSLAGTGTALVDAGEREVIRARGNDRVAFLHRLLTADVASIPVGGGRRALLLDLKGHVVADMVVLVGPDEVRLLVPAGQAAATVMALSKYAIMDDFTAAADPAVKMLAVHGALARERVIAAGLPVPADISDRAPWSHHDQALPSGSVVSVVNAPALGNGLWIFLGDADRLALMAALEAGGTPHLDPTLAEALRIENGEPAWGAEITPEHFPMEVGLGGALDYSKGCYLGQEPIVRIRDRGHINWRLVRLHVHGAGSPTPGDALESDVKPRAGRVTSAAQIPGRSAVALALLHVSVPVGAQVRIRHGEETFSADVVEAPVAR